MTQNSESGQRCFASAFPTTAVATSDAAPVSSTSQVMDYRMALTANPLRTVDRFVHSATSKPYVVQRSSSNKTLEGNNNSSFDHSSIRSQSGRRKSTGISTSDRAKDGCSQDRQKMKAKHNGKSSSASTNDNKKVGRHEQLVDSTKTKEEGLGAKDHASSAPRKFKSSVGEAKAGMSSNASRCKTTNSLSMQDEMSRSSSQKNQRVRSVSSGTKMSGMSRSTSRGHQKVLKCDVTPVSLQAPESSKHGRTRDDDEEGDGFSLEKNTALPQDSESVPGDAKGKRKHRKRRKKIGAKDGKVEHEAASAAGNFVLDSSKSAQLNALPNFDDCEFPNLTDVKDSKNDVVSGPIKYSDILSGRVVSFHF